MRRAWLLAAALLLAAWPIGAQNASTFQALTVDNTTGGVAIAATTLKSNGVQMNYCEGRLETAEIRFRDDGGVPTSSSGTLLEPFETWIAWSAAKAGDTRFIRTTGTSGTLQVRCYPQQPQGH